MAMLDEFVEVVFDILGEIIPAIFRRIGATIRWTYLRKEHKYSEVLKMKGNVAVGLFVVVPIIAALILYLLN